MYIFKMPHLISCVHIRHIVWLRLMLIMSLIAHQKSIFFIPNTCLVTQSTTAPPPLKSYVIYGLSLTSFRYFVCFFYFDSRFFTLPSFFFLRFFLFVLRSPTFFLSSHSFWFYLKFSLSISYSCCFLISAPAFNLLCFRKKSQLPSRCF